MESKPLESTKKLASVLKVTDFILSNCQSKQCIFPQIAAVEIAPKLPMENCLIPLPCPGILTQSCGCKILANSSNVYPLLAQVEETVGTYKYLLNEISFKSRKML